MNGPLFVVLQRAPRSPLVMSNREWSATFPTTAVALSPRKVQTPITSANVRTARKIPAMRFMAFLPPQSIDQGAREGRRWLAPYARRREASERAGRRTRHGRIDPHERASPYPRFRGRNPPAARQNLLCDRRRGWVLDERACRARAWCASRAPRSPLVVE